MSKPSWDDAPSWANHLAMDNTGYWYWYEDCPMACFDRSRWIYGGKHQKAKGPDHAWYETLEERKDV